MKSDTCNQYRNDVTGLRYELAHQCEEKEKDEQELRRLKESVGLKDITCRDQATKIITLEYQLKSSKGTEESITRQANQRDLDNSHVSQELHHANSELAQVKDDNARLLIEAQSLQRSLDMNLAEKTGLVNRQDLEDVKYRDQSCVVLERDTHLRNVTDQLSVSRKEQDHLRGDNQVIGVKNADVGGEINAFKQHSNVLQSQNNGLSTELERFVVMDENIRTQLNRKDRVHELRAKGEEQLANSPIKHR